MTQKLMKLKKKFTDHDHDKCIVILYFLLYTYQFYFTLLLLSEFNKLTAENFAVRLAQANLAIY